MTTFKNQNANLLRSTTESKFAIFYEGKELKTKVSGGFNSFGGIVLNATLPSGDIIKWRSNNNYGKKGFSFDDINNKNYSSTPNHYADADCKINRIPPELRNKLEYKLG